MEQIIERVLPIAAEIITPYEAAIIVSLIKTIYTVVACPTEDLIEPLKYYFNDPQSSTEFQNHIDYKCNGKATAIAPILELLQNSKGSAFSMDGYKQLVEGKKILFVLEPSPIYSYDDILVMDSFDNLVARVINTQHYFRMYTRLINLRGNFDIIHNIILINNMFPYLNAYFVSNICLHLFLNGKNIEGRSTILGYRIYDEACIRLERRDLLMKLPHFTAGRHHLYWTLYLRQFILGEHYIHKF